MLFGASMCNLFHFVDVYLRRKGKKCVSQSLTSCVWWRNRQTVWLKLQISTLFQQLHPSPKQLEPSKTKGTLNSQHILTVAWQLTFSRKTVKPPLYHALPSSKNSMQQ